ncbi:MAG: DNA recombination protein RmuC [Lentimicrobiaceae bacterium]
METTLLIIIGVLVLMNIILMLLFMRSNVHHDDSTRLDSVSQGILRIEQNLKEDFKLNREENNMLNRDNRQELSTSLMAVKKELTDTLQAENKSNRDSIDKTFKQFSDTFERNVNSMNELLRIKFDRLDESQRSLLASNEKKLEEMRITVDEKLQKTLNERLGQSFEIVSRQLETVQKGLGEMQILAQDVGGLKKVLSNVKMRGGIGEVQLSMLLEQILAPEQYAANVCTKKHGSEVVEFAIKLPGKDDMQNAVWLPVDAKFPAELYSNLQDAYDTTDILLIEAAQKTLENAIKKMAKDIHDKYIEPPYTTDFAIMFLPFEGIYAEVVRKAGLLEDLQKNSKVLVTGPSTFAAILNSLQMGFRTLAIQKQSSEVWRILGSVKNEFNKFGDLLEKAQKNIQLAGNTLDEVMGKRTRAIQRKLKDVEIDRSDEYLMVPASEIKQEHEDSIL